MHLGETADFELHTGDRHQIACASQRLIRAIAVLVCGLATSAGAVEQEWGSEWAISRPSTSASALVSTDVEPQQLVESLNELHLPPLVRPLASSSLSQDDE